MTDKIDYEFDLVNPANFKLSFTMYSDKKLFNHIFSKSKDLLLKKHGINVTGTMDINKIIIPDRFYNLIKTIMKKKIKKVSKKIKKDRIEILSYIISEAFFIKQKEKWKISIVLTGDYIDKR